MDISCYRILFVHNGADLYGASRSLLRLSSRLVKDGAKVAAVLPRSGPLSNELRDRGISVFVQADLAIIERAKFRNVLAGVRLGLSVVPSIIHLYRLIKELDPHLIHTNSSVILSSGPAAKLAGVPHLWHVRESFAEFGGLWKFYQHYMNWFSTLIICVSAATAEQFALSVRGRKIRVIHNGFPAEEFNPVEKDRLAEFRKSFSLDEGLPLVGVVGRIKLRRKGQEVVVEAARLLRDRFSGARFLCIGSPYPGNEAHLEKLLALIKDRGLEDYVIYTGDVHDIKAAIASLDILVLSSVQPEPFAGTVIEAMALARPVVATRTGGSIEQVVDGVTGYLVEPGDPLSMAAAIAKLLSNPKLRKEFGENGHHRFMDAFEFESFYRNVLALYATVIPEQIPDH